MSADPLAVHAPGEADLNVYAYVSGSVLKNVDPLGLEDTDPGGYYGDGPGQSTNPDGSLEVPMEPFVEPGDGGSGGGASDGYGTERDGCGGACAETERYDSQHPGVYERAEENGRSAYGQVWFEAGPGTINGDDLRGYAKGVLNSPAETIEFFSRLVGTELDLKAYKVGVGEFERSGELIGGAHGPGVPGAGVVAKAAARLGTLSRVIP